MQSKHGVRNGLNKTATWPDQNPHFPGPETYRQFLWRNFPKNKGFLLRRFTFWGSKHHTKKPAVCRPWIFLALVWFFWALRSLSCAFIASMCCDRGRWHGWKMGGIIWPILCWPKNICQGFLRDNHFLSFEINKKFKLWFWSKILWLQLTQENPPNPNAFHCYFITDNSLNRDKTPTKLWFAYQI